MLTVLLTNTGVLPSYGTFEKKEIRLRATDNGLTITVDNPIRRYYKELEFPVEVDERSAKSTYVNGVLEIVFRKRQRDDAGTEISIE